MAPYVEREWGEKATALMWRVKELADPDGVLGPGVVLSRDPGAHLRDLKTTPPIEEVATTCVECGFCEPVCPSRGLTTTPGSGSCCGGRWRASHRARRCWAPCSRSTSTTASRPAPPTAPAGWPARSRSTPAAWSRICAPAPAVAAIGAGGRWRWRGAGAGSRPPPAPAWGWARRSTGSSARRRCAASAAPPAPPPAASWSPSGDSRCRRPRRGCRPRRGPPPPPSTCRPASTGSSAAPGPGAGPSLAADAGRGLAPRRAAALDPEQAAGQLLRRPVELEGLRRGARPQGERDRRGPLALDRRRRAARRRSTPASCTQASPTPGGVLSEVNAERHAELEILDSVAWAHERLLPRLEVASGSAPASPSTRPARSATWVSRRRWSPSPRLSPMTSTSRPPRPAAVSPATAASSTRS